LSGRGNPQAAPAELVAVIGDSRLKHSAHVRTVAFRPDDAWLAASDDTGFVKIWESATGELIAALATAGGAVAFSPDGKTLLTGGNDATAKLWDLESFQERFVLTGHTERVFAVAYSPRGDLVATGGFDKTIRLWNPADGSPVRTLAETEGYVASLAFSPDGTALAVECADPFTACVLKVADGTRKFKLGMENEHVHSVAWCPDGSKLAVGSSAPLTRLFDAVTGEQLLTIATGQSSGVAAVSFSADGRTIASGSGDGTVALHNVETGTREEKLECHDTHLLSTVFSHRGRRLATSAQDQRIKLWDAATGKESPRVAPGATIIAASPDGRWLALGNHGGVIELWDIAGNRIHATFEGFRRAVGSLAFSPDGRRLAAGGNFDDPVIRIWEIADPGRASILERHAAFVSGLDFSPDGAMLASCAHDGRVKLWNVESGRIVKEFKEISGAASCVAFSHDGRTLAAGYFVHLKERQTRRVKIWDVARGDTIKSFDESPGDVIGVAFGAGDKTLTVGYWPRAVTHWDVARGIERETIHGTGIFALSAGGELSAIGTETDIKLFEPELNTAIAELSLGRSDVYAMRLAFTGDGRHLAVLALNGTVHILRLPVHRE
jgi:WD40 repeat protein